MDSPSAILRSYLRRALRTSKRCSLNPSPAAVHDLRVILRRIRTLLEMNKIWPKRPARGAIKRIKKIAKEANEARDREIVALWFSDLADQSGLHKRSAATLSKILRRESRIAHRIFAERLKSQYAYDLRRLDQDLSSLNDKTGPTDYRLRKQIKRNVSRYEHALRRSMARAKSLFDAKALHACRIDAKHLRYVLESFAKKSRMIPVLKKVQDTLGDMHDLEIVESSLEKKAGSAYQSMKESIRLRKAHLFSRFKRQRSKLI